MMPLASHAAGDIALHVLSIAGQHPHWWLCQAGMVGQAKAGGWCCVPSVRSICLCAHPPFQLDAN